MLSWRNFAGCMAAAGLTFVLMSTAGCRQLSQSVRNDGPVLEGAAPNPPDIYTPPAPNLQTVPQTSAPFPAPLLIPPPAPPTESAQRSFSSDGDAWDWEPVEVVQQEDDEFFPAAPPAYPPAFIAERAEASAARFAAEGIEARKRQEARVPLWPVIVPGPSSLKPVVHVPALAPVPK